MSYAPQMAVFTHTHIIYDNSRTNVPPPIVFVTFNFLHKKYLEIKHDKKKILKTLTIILMVVVCVAQQ